MHTGHDDRGFASTGEVFRGPKKSVFTKTLHEVCAQRMVPSRLTAAKVPLL